MTAAADTLQGDIRPLVREIGKAPHEWRRSDLVKYCLEHGVRVINLHYPGLDGKLKELRLPVNSRAYLERVLAAGERVDGSSLFPGLFHSGASDVYVLPVYRWAFVNPWADDELDLVCRFADADGRPCDLTPDNLLDSLAVNLERDTGASLHALTELEFYLILERDDDRFVPRAQGNYHQSAPFLHGRDVADEILRVVSEVTGAVKYCHSEVGFIDRLDSHYPELAGRRLEQYELEFDLLPIADLACWTTVARWLIRVVAGRHNHSVTFVPKLEEDMAGSGLHVHLALYRGGHNIMRDDQGMLSDDALRLIGGVLGRAPSLTGFGNSVAASYLRLVPNQEAPTRICWGERNRSSLMRVPLGFDMDGRLDQVFNPAEDGPYPTDLARPTVELRSPDGSAFTYLLLAAIVAAVRDGLMDPGAAERARKLRVEGNVFRDQKLLDRLQTLPANAVAAAECLDENRGFFERSGFSPRLLDIVIDKLRVEDDKHLNARLRALPAAERLRQSRDRMHKDAHKH